MVVLFMRQNYKKNKKTTTIAVSILCVYLLLGVVIWILCVTIPDNIMDNYKIISLSFSFLSLLSLILLMLQFFYSRQDSKNMHDERRREKTVEIMMQWHTASSKESRMAELIVNDFSSEKCRCLYNNQRFKVRKRTYYKICECCGKPIAQKNIFFKKDNTDESYWIEGELLNQLRWNVTSYLNNLEIVFVAYHQGIVDKKIIEAQFSFLYHPEKNKNALSTYRSIAGDGNSYPAIELFIRKLQKNHQTEIEEKTEL